MARFRPIPSTHGEYLAGDDGTIWRRGRYLTSRHRWEPPRRVKPGFQGSHGRMAERGRYLKVSVAVNGVTVQRAVHRLVAEAWLDGWHPLYEIHHANGDPMDNRPSNLRLVNRAEHERLHGRDVPEYDVVNCQVDLERRMAIFEGEDPFSYERRARERASRAARGAIRGSSSRNSIRQMIQRCRSLQREIDGAVRTRRKGTKWESRTR